MIDPSRKVWHGRHEPVGTDDPQRIVREPGHHPGAVRPHGHPFHHGGHHDVGRTGHRCFVQQHVGSFQLAAFDHEKFVGDVEIELRTQLLEPEEMGVQPPPADFVAAGFGYVTHAEARQHGADEHHRAAQARAALPVVLRAEVVEIYFAGAKTVCILRELFDLDAHAPQQVDVAA